MKQQPRDKDRPAMRASGRLRAARVLSAFLLLTIALMPLQALLRWRGAAAAIGLQHRYWRAVAWLIGMRVDLRSGGLPRQGPALICANHVSWLDIVALSAAAPVSFIAKQEVTGWPFFGVIARLGGTIFIDRSRRTATAGAAASLGQRLAAGEAFVLFAEGTSSEGVTVLPFRSSLFAAADGSVSVHPVALAYTGRHGLPLARARRARFAWAGDMALAPHLWAIAATGPFEVSLAAAPALSLRQLGSRKALAAACEAAVRRELAGLMTGRPVCKPAEIR